MMEEIQHGMVIQFAIVVFVLFLIIYKLNKIMATIAELSAKVDELQVKLDAEQEQIQNAINALNETVASLQAQLADGGTAEERQAVLDKLNSAITDLEGTVAP